MLLLARTAHTYCSKKQSCNFHFHGGIPALCRDTLVSPHINGLGILRMKLLAPFITMICLAILFSTAGLITQFQLAAGDFLKNNTGLVEACVFVGLGVSVTWFAVWVLRK